MSYAHVISNFAQRHNTWVFAFLGFFSVYLVWAIPAFALSWNEFNSFAYLYGDHIVLPLFNSLSFWLLAKNTKHIPLKLVGLTLLLVVVLAAFLIVFFEPDASASRESGFSHFGLKEWHGVFITLELSLIIFMCGVYPFLSGTYAPLSNAAPQK